MPNFKKVALFLWELEQKKTVTPKTQETYSYYDSTKENFGTLCFG